MGNGAGRAAWRAGPGGSSEASETHGTGPGGLAAARAGASGPEVYGGLSPHAVKVGGVKLDIDSDLVNGHVAHGDGRIRFATVGRCS